MRLRIKYSLPALAVFKGSAPGPGRQVVEHYYAGPFSGEKKITYLWVKTAEELAKVKTDPALLGFLFDRAYPVDSFPRWDYKLTARKLALPEEVEDGPVPRVLLIGETKQLLLSLIPNPNAVELWSVSKVHDPVVRFDRWTPGDIGNSWERPKINAAGCFDAVLCSSTYITRDNLEFISEALRPGGMVALEGVAADMSLSTGMVASRFEAICLVSDETDSAGHPYPPDKKSAVTLFGLKKEHHKWSRKEVSLLDKYFRSLQGQPEYILLPPPVYPPLSSVELRATTIVDDSKLPADKILKAHATPGENATGFIYSGNTVRMSALETFGEVGYIPGRSGYAIDIRDAEKVPGLRAYLKEHDWELKIRGQKSSTSTEVITTPIPVLAATTTTVPDFTAKMLTRQYAEQWFCHETIMDEEGTTSEVEEQLVVPVTPSLVNQMKFFGALKPCVVQGKDKRWYLSAGAIEKLEKETIVEDPDKGPMSVKTFTKVAKLVAFILDGPEAGNRFEAEM